MRRTWSFLVQLFEHYDIHYLCTSVVQNLHFTLFKLLIENRPAAL